LQPSGHSNPAPFVPYSAEQLEVNEYRLGNDKWLGTDF
jgi:hypothetical protein